MEIPKELIEDLKKDKVVPLVGAGMSRLFGYPGWKELIVKVSEEIKHPIDKEEIEVHDNLQLAEALLQHYVQSEQLELQVTELINANPCLTDVLDVKDKYLHKYLYSEGLKRKEREFNEIVVNALTSTRSSLSEISNLDYLKEIPFRHIITTNYDDVLENHIFNNKEYTSLIPQTGQEFEIRDDERLLLKLHGDWERTESIVFTQSQYYRFMNDMVYYNSRLQTILAHNTLLMIGYGFGDINIHDVYFKFLDQLEENENGKRIKKSYIVLTDYDKKYNVWNKETSEIEEKESKYYDLYVKFLKSKRIEVIEAPDLETFLLKFHEEYQESIRVTKESSQSLLDNNKDIIYKVFMENNYSEKMDIEALDFLINRSIMVEEWINEKAYLRGVEILEDENQYYLRLQKYINELMHSVEYKERLHLISLSASIVSKTSTFYEHSSRLENLLTAIEKLDILSYKKKELFELEPDVLKVFTNSFRDIFNFARKEFGKAWDSYKLLKRTLVNKQYKIFELYIWSLKINLTELNSKLSNTDSEYDILDEWYDVSALLIKNYEKEWLDEISAHHFQTEIESLLDQNKQLTIEVKELLDQ
ncbi:MULTISPECIES: SIR2 family protein [unclassified Mammaliicoccus]|uniref:SIR2 family NAD-dependent protein deacylase n=1 Tax=Mammaliicoccus TaxID=2803850 RepID=UPI001EFB9DD0|nr:MULTISPECIES: SIR2 family protein [unclassified Mammaliicoccus]